MRRTLCLAFSILDSFLMSAAARAQTAFTTKPANLRAGPSRDYPKVMTVGPGTAVQVAGCVDDWTWCDVIVGPDRGWMYAGNLDYPYEGRRVIVLENGPVIGFPIVTFAIGPYWDQYYRARPWYGRRAYWIGRPPPPHWVGRPIVRQPVGRPVVAPVRPRPVVRPAPPRAQPVRPRPRTNPRPVPRPPG
jgi:uncharacterized protein YraI